MPNDARTALAVVALAAFCGCRPAARPSTGSLVVLVGGDTQGWIVPCGCTSNQSGGLPRRASCAKRLRRDARVILADVGGAASGTSAYDRLRFEAVLEGEMAMGIAAHNIGASEARLGAEYLRGLHVPLLSANCLDDRGRLIAEPLRVVEAAGLRVAIVGVLDEQYASESIRVTPPQEAVLRVLREAHEPYDVVVVLAYLPGDRLRRLARSLPEADLVLDGPTGQPIPPETIGPALLASATNKGKFLVCCRRTESDSSGRWTGEIIELDDSFGDDPRMVAGLDKYYDRLAKRDFTPEETSFVDSLLGNPADYVLAEGKSCRECHPEEWKIWEAGQHARAWDSLLDRGAHVDPECQRCHVTGYGLRGGFSSVGGTPEIVNVGCQSCHGPCRAHAGNPDVQTPRFASAGTACIACHDSENSPEFDYETYWTKIRHGESLAVPAPTSEDDR